MSNFYLTFGVQYRSEPHPVWTGADPDGWVLIEAPDEERARKLAAAYFETYWAFLYDEATFNPSRHYYPKMEIARLIWPQNQPLPE